jgi:hypothetical protein
VLVAGDVVVQTSFPYAAVAVELSAIGEFVLAGPALTVDVLTYMGGLEI